MQTGNPLVDGIITSVVISLITMGMGHISSLINVTKDLIVALVLYLWSGTRFVSRWLWFRMTNKEDPTFYKEVHIDYITDDRKINELYKAMHWYLSSNEEIEYLHETPVKFSIEDPIRVNLFEKSGSIVNKQVAQGKNKDIQFHGQQIMYKMTKELINVYTDKERKRENYRITLMANLDKKCTEDLLERFCHHCASEFAKSLVTMKWSQKIFTNSKDTWTGEDSRNRRSVDTVILKDGLKNEIKDDLQLFLDSQDWYHRRDIPYTRGYLFYGLPGTGKTSMIKGISNMCQRHIHYLMLNNVESDAQLLELFKKIKYEETVLVIEDIDCMSSIIEDRKKRMERRKQQLKSMLDHDKDSNKRQIDEDYDSEIEELKRDEKTAAGPSYKQRDFGNRSEANRSKLTLSGILNALDGVFDHEGRILIMTTNHPEVLDEALIRPGRIDRKFRFDYCSKSQIKDLYEMFFETSCPIEQLNKISDNKYSPSHITSLLMRYRNEPKEALVHINDIDDKPIIQSLRNDISSSTPDTDQQGVVEIDADVQ